MGGLPLVVDVKRGSLEDGPGIRSVVFFKGCPLRCVFCQNPETQRPEAEIAFYAGNCIRCGSCVAACPRGAADLGLPGRIDRDLCDRCGRCVEACQGGALKLIGSYYSVESLTEILLRDLAFYRHSGGGVTLSGGECTVYPDYLELLLGRLKAKGVHIVLETSGYFDYEVFSEKILPYLDVIYYDVKILDPLAHLKHLGKPNQRILANLRRLLQEPRVEVHPRVPIVPGVTATEENLAAIADFLCEAGARDVSLLPYNPLGIEMAVKLGRPKPCLPPAFMEPSQEEEIRSMFACVLERKRLTYSAKGSSVPV